MCCAGLDGVGSAVPPAAVDLSSSAKSFPKSRAFRAQGCQPRRENLLLGMFRNAPREGRAECKAEINPGGQTQLEKWNKKPENSQKITNIEVQRALNIHPRGFGPSCIFQGVLVLASLEQGTAGSHSIPVLPEGAAGAGSTPSTTAPPGAAPAPQLDWEQPRHRSWTGNSPRTAARAGSSPSTTAGPGWAEQIYRSHRAHPPGTAWHSPRSRAPSPLAARAHLRLAA